MAKLGFSDRKTVAPNNPHELIALLSEIMSATINNEVEIENVKIALNAATRIVDVMQADTRMKMAAIATQRIMTTTDKWQLIETNPIVVNNTTGEI